MKDTINLYTNNLFNFVYSNRFINLTPHQDDSTFDAYKNHLSGTSDESDIVIMRFHPGTNRDDYISGSSDDDLIHGMSGNDHLLGKKGDDKIFGGEGSDWLYGENGEDHLYGELGDDMLRGGFGDDTYHYSRGDGNDVIYNSHGQDTLDLTDLDPNDISIAKVGRYHIAVKIKNSDETILLKYQLWGGEYGVNNITFKNGETWNREQFLNNLFIEGTDKDDFIYGTSNNDKIFGLAGNDDIVGLDGNDHLYGGRGDDLLKGDHGDDTYHYSRGDGNDVIYNSHGQDTLDLTDLEPNDISIAKVGRSHIAVKIKNSGETILLKYQLWGGEFGVNSITFKGGDTWNREQFLNDLFVEGTDKDDFIYGTSNNDKIFGLAGNDDIVGLDGNDHLYGGRGDDSLEGGRGDDTYHYSRGDGNDVIYNSYGQDTLALTDLDPNDISIAKVGRSHIAVRIKNSDETILLKYQLLGGEYGVNSITFKGGDTWNREKILNRLLQGTDEDDSLIGFVHDDQIYGLAGNDVINGEAGNDHLYGGRGDDLLEGGRGDDTYHYSKGDGNDVIYNSRGQDTLDLTDLEPNDVSIVMVGWSHIAVKIKNSDETILLKYQLLGGEYGVNSITFKNGVTWNREKIIDSLSILGTDKDDLIFGRRSNDNMIYGLGGNDKIYGANGNDEIFGGTGDDQLFGWFGDDTYLYTLGDGNDVIFDPKGQNTLILSKILPSDIRIVKAEEGGHAEVIINKTNEKITLKYQFLDNVHGVNGIKFTNGVDGRTTLWSRADILQAAEESQALDLPDQPFETITPFNTSSLIQSISNFPDNSSLNISEIARDSEFSLAKLTLT